MYPNAKNTAINTNNPKIPTPGVKNNTTPIEVAIAFPPPNLRNIEKQWPITAANP